MTAPALGFDLVFIAARPRCLLRPRLLGFLIWSSSLRASGTSIDAVVVQRRREIVTERGVLEALERTAGTRQAGYRPYSLPKGTDHQVVGVRQGRLSPPTGALHLWPWYLHDRGAFDDCGRGPRVATLLDLGVARDGDPRSSDTRGLGSDDRRSPDSGDAQRLE